MTYHDSENLGYNGSNIHKNYNKLIMRLQRQLIAELNDV